MNRDDFKTFINTPSCVDGTNSSENAFDKRIEEWKCNECHQQVDKRKEKRKVSRWECIICCDFVLCDDCMEKEEKSQTTTTTTTTTKKQMVMTGGNNRFFWLFIVASMWVVYSLDVEQKRIIRDGLSSIILFTLSTALCSEFQTDIRKGFYGCKWNFMKNCFQNALTTLHEIQQMGCLIHLFFFEE